MGRLRYALQLYTVRDHLDEDVAGTLKEVKKMGYDSVEAGGTHGLGHEAFRKLLNQTGLKPISVHVGYDDVTGDTPSVIEVAKIYDVKYVVIGGIDGKLTPDKQGWINCGKALDAGGARLCVAGIQLCYHNHAHEFQPIGGEFPYDILLGAARPENLAAQIDTFWVRYAGLDPVALINKYAGRCPLLHVKDMKDTKSRAFAEVGSGILDWPSIFAAGAAAGTQWYIVEQDTCPRDSLTSAGISAQFMMHQ